MKIIRVLFGFCFCLVAFANVEVARELGRAIKGPPTFLAACAYSGYAHLKNPNQPQWIYSRNFEFDFDKLASARVMVSSRGERFSLRIFDGGSGKFQVQVTSKDEKGGKKRLSVLDQGRIDFKTGNGSTGKLEAKLGWLFDVWCVKWIRLTPYSNPGSLFRLFSKREAVRRLIPVLEGQELEILKIDDERTYRGMRSVIEFQVPEFWPSNEATKEKLRRIRKFFENDPAVLGVL